VVVVLSGAGGTWGEARELLKEARRTTKKVLISTGVDSVQSNAAAIEDIDVQHLSGLGPELVLVDGNTAVFGGISRRAETPLVIRSQAVLEGLTAWLRQAVGIEVMHSPQDLFVRNLVERLESLEADTLRPRDEESQASIAPSLWTRLRDLQTQLLLESSLPLFWMPLEEVLSLVESWDGPQPRVILCCQDHHGEARTVGPLLGVAAARGAECATWPDPTPVADMVVAGEIVLIGYSLIVGLPCPDFLAVRDPELAGILRAYTSSFPVYASQ
jgi:hypothetical protein